MRYCFYVAGMVFLVVLSAFRLSEEFVKTEIYEGVTVKLPKSFLPMSEAMLQRNYLSARPPLAAYTREDGQVIFGMNTSNTQWQTKDLPMLQNFYRSNILELYDEVKFLQDTVVSIQGRPFATFELVATVRGEEDALNPQKPLKNYVYVQYTVYKEKTYVFDFTCSARQQNEWQDQAQVIMGSVTMK